MSNTEDEQIAAAEIGDERKANAKGKSIGVRALHPYGAVKFTWEQFVYENPNWEQTILDLAQDGEGKTAWKVYLGLNTRTFHRFLEQEEFIDVVEKAEMLERLYWEREARRMVSGDSTKYPGAGRGNAFVFSLIMKNKFGWDNKTSNSLPSPTAPLDAPSELTTEQLEQELLSRGLPSNIFGGFEPEPIDYSEAPEKEDSAIEGQFTEVEG